MQKKEFEYTNEDMVKDLLGLVPYNMNDSVLDVGSGRNKVWFKNIIPQDKYECEIEDGKDFFEWEEEIDWLVGNPPFQQGWLFLEKAASIAQKGIAFLGNINFWNSLTPGRLEKIKKKGFYISKLHIVNDKRWFGRYYFIIFTKKYNGFISWDTKVYSNKKIL